MLFQHLFMHGKFFSPDGDGGGGSAANADGGDGDEGDDSGNQSGGDSSGAATDDRAELKEALAKERKAARDASQALKVAQKKIDDAAEAKAREDGDYKKLLEARDKELADLKADLNTREMRERKAAIAKKVGLPDELINRLKDGDDSEIEADAKELAKHIKGPDAPDTDAGERTKPGAKTKKDDAYKNPSHWL